MRKNPYRWDSNNPKQLIELPLFAEIRDALLEDERLVIVGGHGMGKSVLLHWLTKAFDPEQVRVELISNKPADYSVPGCVRQLARKLGVTVAVDDITELFDDWYVRHKELRLVLLYDEIDRYVDDFETARNFLNALAKAHEQYTDRLGIAIAGGLGVYMMEASLGSTFTNRAGWEPLAPFTRDDIEQLANPFREEERPLSGEVFDAVEQFSGGNPALVTYALHAYWDVAGEIDANAVLDVQRHFRQRYPGFKSQVYRGLGIDEERDTDANRLWAYVEAHPGTHEQAELLGQVQATGSGTELKLEKILRLLQASGLIRLDGDPSASYVTAEVIPSFLRPLRVQAPAEHRTRAAQFHHDMESALRVLSRYRLDLYQDQEHKKLSREAVFSAFLATCFELSGWDIVLREAQQGPGYVDILLSHPAFRDQPKAVVEVKLETNPKVSRAHRQVLKYYDQGSPDEQCMAVVIIAGLDKGDEELRQGYRSKCLPASEFDIEDLPVAPPVPLGFRARLRGDAGRDVWVSHYLLNLRRGNV